MKNLLNINNKPCILLNIYGSFYWKQFNRIPCKFAWKVVCKNRIQYYVNGNNLELRYNKLILADDGDTKLTERHICSDVDANWRLLYNNKQFIKNEQTTEMIDIYLRDFKNLHL